MAGANTNPGPRKRTVISGSIVLVVAAFVLLAVAQMQQGGSGMHSAVKSGSRLPALAATKLIAAYPSSDGKKSVSSRPPKGIAGLSTEVAGGSDYGSFKDSSWWMNDDDIAALNEEGDNRVNPQEGAAMPQTLISPSSDEDETEPVYCKECCYRYTTIDQGIFKKLDKSLLKERGCQKRLPDAMIIGVKKGGTTTLKNFISYHPDVAFAQKELKFFTSRSEMAKGLDYYREEMMYSTHRQVSMEKTPAYSHYLKVPGIIKRALPNVKLIIIMRDPVKRAVSDYVHVQFTLRRWCKKHINSSAAQFITVPPICDFKTGYKIADTFEASVIDSSGNIKADSHFISKGIYVQDIERYLKYFRPDQILTIDGEAFIHDPYPSMKRVEQFLGIRDYFTRDSLYFDERKGFYCLNKPIPKNCMSRQKGRPHPVVQEEVLEKLRDFYRPYNKALAKLVGLDLNWSS